MSLNAWLQKEADRQAKEKQKRDSTTPGFLGVPLDKKAASDTVSKSTKKGASVPKASSIPSLAQLEAGQINASPKRQLGDYSGIAPEPKTPDRKIDPMVATQLGISATRKGPLSETERRQKNPFTIEGAMYLFDMLEYGTPTYGAPSYNTPDRRAFASAVQHLSEKGMAAPDQMLSATWDLVWKKAQENGQLASQRKKLEWAQQMMVDLGLVAATRAKNLKPGFDPNGSLFPKDGRTWWQKSWDSAKDLATGKTFTDPLQGVQEGGVPSFLQPADFERAAEEVRKLRRSGALAVMNDSESLNEALRTSGLAEEDNRAIRAILKDMPDIAANSGGFDTYMKAVQGVVNPFTTATQLSGTATSDLNTWQRGLVAAGDFIAQIAVGGYAAGVGETVKAGQAGKALLHLFSVDNLMDAPDLYESVMHRDGDLVAGSVDFTVALANQFNPTVLFDSDKQIEEKVITGLTLLTFGGGGLYAKAQQKRILGKVKTAPNYEKIMERGGWGGLDNRYSEAGQTLAAQLKKDLGIDPNKMSEQDKVLADIIDKHALQIAGQSQHIFGNTQAGIDAVRDARPSAEQLRQMMAGSAGIAKGVRLKAERMQEQEVNNKLISQIKDAQLAVRGLPPVDADILGEVAPEAISGQSSPQIDPLTGNPVGAGEASALFMPQADPNYDATERGAINVGDLDPVTGAPVEAESNRGKQGQSGASEITGIQKQVKEQVSERAPFWQIRAKAGGEIGVNGQHYKGGQFLATSPETEKGAFKKVRKMGESANRSSIPDNISVINPPGAGFYSWPDSENHYAGRIKRSEVRSGPDGQRFSDADEAKFSKSIDWWNNLVDSLPDGIQFGKDNGADVLFVDVNKHPDLASDKTISRFIARGDLIPEHLLERAKEVFPGVDIEKYQELVRWGDARQGAINVGDLDPVTGEPAEAKSQEQSPTKAFHAGEEIEYTGNTQEIHGGTFYEFKYLTGPKVGEMGVTQNDPGGKFRADQAEKAKQEFADQQQQFSKLQNKVATDAENNIERTSYADGPLDPEAQKVIDDQVRQALEAKRKQDTPVGLKQRLQKARQRASLGFHANVEMAPEGADRPYADRVSQDVLNAYKGGVNAIERLITNAHRDKDHTMIGAMGEFLGIDLEPKNKRGTLDPVHRQQIRDAIKQVSQETIPDMIDAVVKDINEKGIGDKPLQEAVTDRVIEQMRDTGYQGDATLPSLVEQVINSLGDTSQLSSADSGDALGAPSGNSVDAIVKRVAVKIMDDKVGDSIRNSDNREDDVRSVSFLRGQIIDRIVDDLETNGLVEGGVDFETLVDQVFDEAYKTLREATTPTTKEVQDQIKAIDQEYDQVVDRLRTEGMDADIRAKYIDQADKMLAELAKLKSIENGGKEPYDASVDNFWGLTQEEYKMIESGGEINTPERKALRQEITRRIAENTPIKGTDKVAVLILGGGGVGKNRFIETRNILNNTDSVLFDLDEIKPHFPEFANSYGGPYTYSEASAITDAYAKQLTGLGANFVSPGTGKNFESYKSKFEDLKAKGYSVRIYHLSVSEAEQVRRLKQRVMNGGHYVPVKLALEHSRQSAETWSRIIDEGLYDEYEQYDNENFQTIRSGSNGSGNGESNGVPPESSRDGEQGSGSRRRDRDIAEPGEVRSEAASPSEVSQDDAGRTDRVDNDLSEAPQESPSGVDEGAPGQRSGSDRATHRGEDGGGTRDVQSDDRADGSSPNGSELGGDQGSVAEGDRRDNAGIGTTDDGRGSGSDRRNEPRPENHADFRFASSVDARQPRGKGAKAKNAVAALEARKNARERGWATTEEQKAMALFPGWGPIKNYISSSTKEGKTADGRDIRSFMDRDDVVRAIAATANAHYTSPEVVDAVWQGLHSLGVTGGKVIETSAGSGLFKTLAPQTLDLTWDLVEMDKTTGEMLQFAHPNSNVLVSALQDTNLPSGSYDVVVSNVPFANEAVYDPRLRMELGEETAEAVSDSVHNYFFAKALQLVRPGGIVAFITSRYTMDGTTEQHQFFRDWVDQNADFLGAVRLPDSAFETAANTEVVTDLIFLRRKNLDSAVQPKQQKFTKTKTFELEGTETYDYTKGWVKTAAGKAPINEYYVKNPGNIIGTPKFTGTMYQANSYNVEFDGNLEEMGAAVQDAIKGLKLKKGTFDPRDLKPSERVALADLAPSHILTGEVYRDPKTKEVRVKGMMGESAPLEGKVASNKKLWSDYLDLKDAVRELNQSRMASDAKRLSKARSAVESAYKKFAKAHGPLHANTVTKNDQVRYKHRGTLAHDSMWASVFAIENYNPDSHAISGLSENVFEPVSAKTSITRAENIKDAINISINNTGMVDAELVSQLLGKPIDQVVKEAGDSLFKVPNTESIYEDRTNYLSGNVKKKLREAQDAVDNGQKEFERNVAELEKVQPPDVAFENIFFSGASTFLPKEVLSGFLQSATGIPMDRWIVGRKESGVVISTNQFLNTPRIRELTAGFSKPDKFINAAFNDAPLEVKDNEGDIDEEATQRVNAARLEFAKMLTAWVANNPQAKIAVERAYNDKVNVWQAVHFDGSNLEFPGLASMVELRKHRVDGIDRAMRNRFTLWWHTVGTGKTYTAAMLAMKRKQTGLSKKQMFVATKPTITQIAREFSEAYPSAKILAADDHSFTKLNRQQFLATAISGDWDIIIITHEQLVGSGNSLGLSMSEEGIRGYYNAEIDRLLTAAGLNIDQARAISDKDSKVGRDLLNDWDHEEQIAIRDVAHRISKMEDQMRKKIDSYRKDAGGISFESLGIDNMIVDEAHFFKGVPIFSNKPSGHSSSAKALEMLMRIEHLRKTGGSAVFMTGTALVNDFAEVYGWMRYMNPEAMSDVGITDFNSFSANYGGWESKGEVGTDGKYKMASRIRFIQNLPALADMLYQSMDIVDAKMVMENQRDTKYPFELPPLRDWDGNKVDAPLTEAHQPTAVQREIMAYVDEQLKNLPNKFQRQEGDYWRFQLTAIARFASNDARLAAHLIKDPGLAARARGDVSNKIKGMVKRVSQLYKESTDNKGTQIMFVDQGVTGGNSFDLYTDIIDRLVAEGIPRSEIYTSAQIKNNRDKAKLSEMMKSGKIRVLIGTRAKLGVGLNIQKKIIGLHHMDFGWNPAMLEQGNGRGLRNGNEYTKKGGIVISYNVTVGTFDQTMANRTDVKHKLFMSMTDALSGKLTGVYSYEMFDDSPGTITAAEATAVAMGDPRIIELFEAIEEVDVVGNVSKGFDERQASTKASIEFLTQTAIPNLELDEVKAYAKAKQLEDDPVLKMNGSAVEKPTIALAEMIDGLIANAKDSYSKSVVASYGGIDLTYVREWRVGKYIHGLYYHLASDSYEDGGHHTFEIGEDAPSGINVLNGLKSQYERVATAQENIARQIENAKRDLAEYRESAGKPNPHAAQIAEAQAKVDRLEFETGITGNDLSSGNVSGFNYRPAQNWEVESGSTADYTTTEIDEQGNQRSSTEAVEILRQNDRGMFWVKGSRGEFLVLPGQIKNVKSADARVNDAINGGKPDEAGAQPDPQDDPQKRVAGSGYSIDGLDVERLTEDLIRVARGHGTTVNLNSPLAKTILGKYVQKTKKKPGGEVQVKGGIPAEIASKVIAHEIGHMIDARTNFDGNADGNIARILGADPMDAKMLDGELLALTRALVGEAEFNKNRKYFSDKRELWANYIEAKIFAPALAERHAPTVDRLFAMNNIGYSAFADVMKIAERGVLEFDTWIMPGYADLRQTYIKELGRYLGLKAYQNEIAYRARRAHALKRAEELVAEKFKGIDKAEYETMFEAAEGIRRGPDGELQFGTRKWKTVNPNKANYAEESGALDSQGWWRVGEDEFGHEVWETWRVTPGRARDLYRALTPDARNVVDEFTADLSEAKTLFSREMLREYMGLEGTIEGWVHHFHPDSVNQRIFSKAGLKKKKTAARLQRTEAEGYSKDFYLSSLKAISEAMVEYEQHQFIEDQFALMLEPLAEGETLKEGWVTVRGDINQGFFDDGDVHLKILGKDGKLIPIRGGEKYQVPRTLYDRYLKHREHRREIGMAERLARGLSQYYTANLLVHPGTWTTNALSGGLQFGAKIITDLYSEVLRFNGMQKTAGNFMAMLQILTPSGWKSVPDAVYGGKETTMYSQFFGDNDPATKINPGLNQTVDKALYAMSAVERYWKKVIVQSEVNAKSYKEGRPIDIEAIFADKEFLAHINDMVDFYAYDYQNVPDWLDQWRKHPLGQLTKPFMVYPYKYSKMLARMMGASLDRNLAWQDRLANTMALATMVGAAMIVKGWRDDETETDIDISNLPEGVEVDQLKSVIDSRGRLFISTDQTGRDVYLRVAKYPFLNIGSGVAAVRDGDWNMAQDMLVDQINGFGPALEVPMIMMGWSGPYDKYTDGKTRAAKLGANFVPGTRVFKDLADAFDPVKREYPKTPGMVWGNLVPAFTPDSQEYFHGPERTFKVPLSRGVKNGQRTTEDLTITKAQEDAWLRLLLGFSVTRVDPDWQKRFLDRAEDNAIKRAKEKLKLESPQIPVLPSSRHRPPRSR